MMAEIKKHIVDILNTVKQMVLCTSKGDKPWAVTLFFAFDHNSIYFFSREHRRHSQEIASNQHVAGAVASEHSEGLGSPVRGVQFEGNCNLVKSGELKHAYDLFKKRFPNVAEIHSFDQASKELYKIEVKKFVLFDSLNFPDDPRKELVE